MLNARVTNVSHVEQTAIKSEEYEEFQQFLEESCGIVLGNNKHYLVSSRLQRLLRESSIASISELLDRLRGHGASALRAKIIDAMTTNETFWFRDGYPYELLKTFVFPELVQRKVRSPRIWSAACSSGQEPYSISITFQEFAHSNPGAFHQGVQITATDISSAVLAEARQGIYDAAALSRGLSEERKRRFFSATNGPWQVKEHVRKSVLFRELNLMHGYAILGKFDVIFCRNVLIYFSPELKTDILTRMAKALNPGGYLFLGSSESIAKYTDAFARVRGKTGTIYQLKG